MSSKLLSSLAFCIFHFNISISQTNDFNKIEKEYSNFFSLNYETIFTQLNKSKYFSNEEIWFKSYIYDIKTQLPYLTTTNVYAEIYNENGLLIFKKLFYAENGMTHGNFALGKRFKPGIYFLKITTNWMKNFENEHYSLQPFEILGNMEVEPTEILSEALYDFQLLPEGGKFLNDAQNTIGFKILDHNGKGVKINSGKVTDSEKNIISTFTSNDFGMGSFNVFLNYKRPLTVSVTLDDGSELYKLITIGETKGITLSINNLNPEKLFVNIKTNMSTLSDLLNRPFYLLIHRDGLLKKVKFNFTPNKLNYMISIPKSELFEGINILTVFNDEHNPLVERIIYNPSNKVFGNIEFLGHNTKEDSTEIRLRLSRNDDINKNISISVLPASTKSYQTNNTILTSFLLKPYISGNIENPWYYFSDTDRKIVYDLDLLLLTQGWSSYSWNDIFNTAPVENYHFEGGMQIKGKLNSADIKKDDEVVLYSGGSGLRVTSSIEDDNTFSFENLFLVDSSSVSLSLLDSKGKLFKPNIYYNIFPIFQNDSLKIKPFRAIKKTKFKVNLEDFVTDNTTILDTVLLEAEKKKKVLNTIAQGSFRSNYIDLSERYDPIGLIIDVIRDNGFDVQIIGNDLTILSRRGVTSFSQGQARPNVFVDNSPVTGFDLNQLLYLRIADVEELYIARTPSGVGGTGGNINIFTRKGIGVKTKKLDNYNNSLVKFGFTIPDRYSSPYYNRNNQKLFAEYAVLNWIPNLKINEQGEFVFKIPNYLYEDINLYIEGMGNDGSLISVIETININRKTD